MHHADNVMSHRETNNEDTSHEATNNELDVTKGVISESNSDNDSFMTRRVKQHKHYTRISAEHRGLCPMTSSMENIVHEYQRRLVEALSTLHQSKFQVNQEVLVITPGYQ
jgi:hypothetical protein